MPNKRAPLRITHHREWVMFKWNEAATEAARKNEEVRSERNRRQDDDFCRALRAALFARKESCPEGVSTEPGTKKPVLHYQPPA
jgi:hypothetical protein